MTDKPNPQDYYVAILPIDDQWQADPTLIERFPQHAQLIGYIVAEWSQVEFKLIALLSLHLRVSAPVLRPMLYAIESSKARLETMRAAFSRSVGDVAPQEELLALLDDASGLLVQRNKYAHALYGHSPAGAFAIVGMRQDTVTDVPLHDLIHQFERMKELSYRIGRVLAVRLQLFGAQPPTPASPDAGQTGPSG